MRVEGIEILLKFSSIVFVKYHVWFLFAEHFDQIELMFVQHNTGPANPCLPGSGRVGACWPRARRKKHPNALHQRYEGNGLQLVRNQQKPRPPTKMDPWGGV